MNSLDFFKAFGNIEDAFILEVEEYKKKRKKRTRIVVKSAACMVLFMSFCFLFWQSNTKKLNWSHKDEVREESGVSDEDNLNSHNPNHEISTNEIMENLNLFFTDHEMPNWFGDYYLENNVVYVLLVNNSEANQERVKKWAKSENIIFQKAEFSSVYLNKVIQNIYEDIINGKIDFVNKIMLENKENRIKIETDHQIDDKEKQFLYSYDKLGKGGALIIHCD